MLLLRKSSVINHAFKNIITKRRLFSYLSIKKETIVADVVTISGWKLINYGEVLLMDKSKIQKYGQ